MDDEAKATIRLLIPDTDIEERLFQDLDLQRLYVLEDGDVRRTAAAALEIAASNEAMVSKVIRTQDLATDGVKVAAELRARAALLRAQADDADLAAMDDAGFAVVDFDPYAAWR